LRERLNCSVKSISHFETVWECSAVALSGTGRGSPDGRSGRLPTDPLGAAAMHAVERLGLAATARLHRGPLVRQERRFGGAELVGFVIDGFNHVIGGWAHDGAPGRPTG